MGANQPFKIALLISAFSHFAVGYAVLSSNALYQQAGVSVETCSGVETDYLSASIVAELPSDPNNMKASGKAEIPTSEGEVLPTPPNPPTRSIPISRPPKIKEVKHHHHHHSAPSKTDTKEKTNLNPEKAVSSLTTAGAVQGETTFSGAQGGSNLSKGSKDASPSYFRNPPPPYPESARRMRREGVVKLSVTVEADGNPSLVSLKTSSGHPSLDEAAEKAVRAWKFKPGEIDGTPVRSQVEVPVRFSLK